MNFNTRRVNVNAWKGTGTVFGVHTHQAPVRVAKLEQTGDTENTVEFKDDEVVVAKDLRVLGQLITPGFPPPGGDMSLPTDPTFASIHVTSQEHGITVYGPVSAEGTITGGLIESTGGITAQTSLTAPTITTSNISSDGTLTATGTWNFSSATVTGIDSGGQSYESIVEYSDHVDITKRLTISHMGWNNDNVMNFQGNKNFTDFTNFNGTVNFTDASVVGIPSPYASISEQDSHITMTKPLHLAYLQSNVTHTDSLQSQDTGVIAVHDTIDFSNATVTGLNMGGYQSITEESDRILMQKNLDMGVSDVVTPFVGTPDAGIQLEEGAKRINFVLDDNNMLWSLFTNSVDGTTTTLHYSQNTMMNIAQCHKLSPRPGYNKIEFSGVMDFGEATVEGLYPGLSANPDLNRLIVDTDTTLYFADSMSNPGIATQITEYAVQTNFVGRPNNGWYFDTVGPMNAPVSMCDINGDQILYISQVQIVHTVPIVVAKKGSSGNFTHCHLTEGAQEETWEVGRVVTSTGEFCARDENGSLISTPSATPDGSHAMCKVQYSVAGDSPLGIITSVEAVADQAILHEHGGITLKVKIAEPDGHNMVRVAASGDVMAWVVQPTFDEVNVPPMSGLWNKCVGDGYGGHNILSSHVGVEADGHLAVDNQIIDTSTATVGVTASDLTIIPAAPTMTPSLFSGIYTKTINGISQNVNVILVCNEDYSFMLSEHLAGVETRLAAVEATLAELLGPE